MASQSYPTLGFSLLQELGFNEIIKKNRAYLVNPGGRRREMIIPENSFSLKLQQPWKPFSSLTKSNHFLEFDSTMMKPSLLDVHEIGQEELLEFLVSRSGELKERGFDMSLLSDLMDLHASRSSSSLLYLNQEPVKPLLDPMMHNPEFSISSDAQILFSSSRSELNDMVSIAAEIHMPKNSAKWRKLSRLVPQFQRFDSEVFIDTPQLNAVNLDAVTQLVPLKSPEKTRVKPSPKKQTPKLRDREKDLYKRNHLHACESLISLMIGSEQHKQSTLLSLKKSRGDLSELLTQFSIGIAGTGIAVFFSVVCNVASGRVPFCANKVFDSALSLSLVLLSWAVSRLRGAIVDVNRKAIKDEETSNRVERRIKDVYIRAATVITMLALRFG